MRIGELINRLHMIENTIGDAEVIFEYDEYTTPNFEIEQRMHNLKPSVVITVYEQYGWL